MKWFLFSSTLLFSAYATFTMEQLKAHAKINARFKEIMSSDQKTISLQEVEDLLQQGANTNMYLDRFNPSYLHILAGNDDCSSLIELLLNNHANPNFRDYLKQTPLHIAALKGALKNLCLLLKFGAFINATDQYNRTPLHSLFNGLQVLDDIHFECAKKLVEAKSNLSISSKFSGTPIEIAQSRGWTKFNNFLKTQEFYNKLCDIKRNNQKTNYLALLPTELLKEVASFSIK